MRRQLVFLFLAWAASPVSSQEPSKPPVGSPLPELVDLPSAEVVDHYGYYTSFRFYSDGGLLTRATFGVLPRLNVGFGLDVERFLGIKEARTNRPTLDVKIRFFDGRKALPALAVGYDGQGHFFNRGTDTYLQRERGFYFVGTQEIIFPGLEAHGGFNIFDFESNAVQGFVGLSYTYMRTAALLLEADAIHDGPTSRYNGGLRFFVTRSFVVDFALRNGRNIGLANPNRKTERIVRLGYIGSF